MLRASRRVNKSQVTGVHRTVYHSPAFTDGEIILRIKALVFDFIWSLTMGEGKKRSKSPFGELTRMSLQQL